MTQTYTVSGSLLAAFLALCFAALIPMSVRAAPSPNAFLGGGNALSRATSGESQGLTHATSTSGLIDHLTFASTRGGRSEEVPPQNENTNDGEDAEDSSLPDNANQHAEDNANGGSGGGNGGNGGAAAEGGLVRAGSVVTHSTAVNVINTNIVRISNR